MMPSKATPACAERGKRLLRAAPQPHFVPADTSSAPPRHLPHPADDGKFSRAASWQFSYVSCLPRFVAGIHVFIAAPQRGDVDGRTSPA